MMGDSEEIVRRLREWVKGDRDVSYTFRDYAFMLMRLWRADRGLFRQELMEFLYFVKSSNVLSEEQLDELTNLSLKKPHEFVEMLIRVLPHLNLGKEQGQPSQSTQQAQSGGGS